MGWIVRSEADIDRIAGIKRIADWRAMYYWTPTDSFYGMRLEKLKAVSATEDGHRRKLLLRGRYESIEDDYFMLKTIDVRNNHVKLHWWMFKWSNELPVKGMYCSFNEYESLSTGDFVFINGKLKTIEKFIKSKRSNVFILIDGDRYIPWSKVKIIPKRILKKIL